MTIAELASMQDGWYSAQYNKQIECIYLPVNYYNQIADELIQHMTYTPNFGTISASSFTFRGDKVGWHHQNFIQLLCKDGTVVKVTKNDTGN